MLRLWRQSNRLRQPLASRVSTEVRKADSGQLTLLLQRSFWRQSYVAFAIMAEFSLGLHDLMLSGCSYSAERNLAEAGEVGDPSGDGGIADMDGAGALFGRRSS